MWRSFGDDVFLSSDFGASGLHDGNIVLTKWSLILLRKTYTNRVVSNVLFILKYNANKYTNKQIGLQHRPVNEHAPRFT